MIELGQSLRAAREARGYTVKQLAEVTKMAPSKIEDLENEDFSHIAAPIYGRGFVKLYCEAVGLDPKPFVSEFMDIMNGNREPEIKSREVAAPMPQPVERPFVSVEEPVADEPPPVCEPFRLEPELRSPQTELKAPPAPDDIQMQTTRPDEEPNRPQRFLSRYAGTARTADAVFSSSYLRFGILTAGAALLALLFFCGIRALYRTTSSMPDAQSISAEPTSRPETDKAPSQTPPPAAPEKARTPQEIPSLYID